MSVGISIFVGKFKYFSLRYMLSYLPVCTVNQVFLDKFCCSCAHEECCEIYISQGQNPRLKYFLYTFVNFLPYTRESKTRMYGVLGLIQLLYSDSKRVI
jgi:hypothetical protein